MIDMKTGRFTWGDGLELYPGMTREDFFKSKIYAEELKNEKDKENLTKWQYSLKKQNIDGMEMSVLIRFSSHDYVEEIIITKPEFYNWPNWPEDIPFKEYAYGIKAYNDEFVRRQTESTGGVHALPGCFPSESWGYIRSNISLIHTPSIEVVIRYDEIPFLEKKGYDFSKYSLLEILEMDNVPKEK